MEDQIRQLEVRLLQPEVRRTPEEVAKLLAPEFIEFGSSGQIFTKAQILEVLKHEEPFRWSFEEFKTSQLAPGTVLATYRAVRHGASGEPPIRSLRSSIWKYIDDHWQMVFHQGTALGEA